jgi:hypothetical protein
MVAEMDMATEMEMEMDSLESRISTRLSRWIHQGLEDTPWSRTPEVVVDMDIIPQGSVVLPEPMLAAQASHRMDTIRSHFLSLTSHGNLARTMGTRCYFSTG